MNKKNTYLLLLILGTVFWGISFSITKIAIGSSSPVIFSFYRLLLATLILSLVFCKSIKTLSWLTIKAGIIPAIPLACGIYLQTQGIIRSTAANCALIAGICVLILPLFKLLTQRKTVPVKMYFAVVFALSGLCLISTKNSFNLNTGDLYTLSSVFGFVIYQVQLEKRPINCHIGQALVPMFAMCTLLAFMMALSTPLVNWKPDRSSFWLGVGFCAVFSTAFMYTISTISQPYIGAERIAKIYLFEPVIGLITAYWILGESFTNRQLIGGALIIAGNVLSGSTGIIIDHQNMR